MREMRKRERRRREREGEVISPSRTVKRGVAQEREIERERVKWGERERNEFYKFIFKRF